MTHKDAPPETSIQRATREHWSKALGHQSVGWGRDKHGRFLAEFARQAESAWIAAMHYSDTTEDPV